MRVALPSGLGRSAIRPPIPRLLRTWCTHSFRSREVVPSANHKVPTAPPSAMPIESQRTTALLPSLTQLARISEPRIASDQTRGVCLLCAIVFHPLELVFGLHLGLWNHAVLAGGSKRTEYVSRFQHGLTQPPIRRRNRSFHRQFDALEQ